MIKQLPFGVITVGSDETLDERGGVAVVLAGPEAVGRGGVSPRAVPGARAPQDSGALHRGLPRRLRRRRRPPDLARRVGRLPRHRGPGGDRGEVRGDQRGAR